MCYVDHAPLLRVAELHSHWEKGEEGERKGGKGIEENVCVQRGRGKGGVGVRRGGGSEELHVHYMSLLFM